MSYFLHCEIHIPLPTIFIGVFICYLFFAQIIYYLLTSESLQRFNYSQLDNILQRKIINRFIGCFYRFLSFCLASKYALKQWNPNLGLNVFNANCEDTIMFYLLIIIFICGMLFELSRVPEYSIDLWIHHILIIINATMFLDGKLDLLKDPVYCEIMCILIIGLSLLFINNLSMAIYGLTQSLLLKARLLKIVTKTLLIILLIFFTIIPILFYCLHFNRMALKTKIVMPFTITINLITEMYVLNLTNKIKNKKCGQYNEYIQTKTNDDVLRTPDQKQKSITGGDVASPGFAINNAYLAYA